MEKIDNIYVINMDYATERLNNIKKQLEEQDLKFTRIPGIDVSKLDNDIINNEFTTFCKYFCSPSIKGCFLSHKKCWESVVKNNEKYAIIMEDDCILHNDFVNKVNEIINELNTDYSNWDFTYLGYFGNNFESSNYLFHNILKLFIPSIKKEKINGKYILRPEISLGTHCYLITNDCAKKLLKHLKKGNFHVDYSILKESKHFNIYASKTQLALQYSNPDSSSQITHNFPKILNYLFDRYDENKITYSYYLSIPIIRILWYDLNMYFVLFLMILLLTPNKFLNQVHNILFLFLLIEFLIEPKNFKIIIIWVIILYISVYRTKNYTDISSIET
jgi:GR25 family glycosyltransferase involved in LPS biosynthesis